MTFGTGHIEHLCNQYYFGYPRKTSSGSSTGKGYIAVVAFPKDMTTRDTIHMEWAGSRGASGDDPGFRVQIAEHDGTAFSTDWVWALGASMDHEPATYKYYSGSKAVTSDLVAYCTGSGSGAGATDGTLTAVIIKNTNASEGQSHVFGFRMYLRRG